MAHQIEDDGFHEIQLNGKQLVFLFMAATVVSVVIFLCGVLVGRGVRVERGSVADVSAPGNTAESIAPQPMSPAPPAQPQAGADPTAAQPPAATSEDLSYFRRLEKPNALPERLKPAGSDAGSAPAKPVIPAEKATTGRTAAKTPAPAAAPKAAAPQHPPQPAPVEKEAPRATAPEPTRAEPAGDGYAVQIAALGVRSDADAIAKRLSSKGYAAYVLAPPDGKPSVFRVRVGKFPTKREAETVAARLQREEQLKPWVTR